MDLFGTKRRNKDLMILHKSRHDLVGYSPISCSCGWYGVDVVGRPQHEIESYFAGHIRASR